MNISDLGQRPRSPISVVVCAYNGLGYTKLLLESLRRNSTLEHEIIVWSDGSTDGTDAWLREQEGLKWHHDKTNRGICTAMNRASRLATREYLFFPNTDHVLAQGWDLAMLRRLEPRTVVSLSCIEPGIVPVAPVFHTKNLGGRWEEFDWPGFDAAARELASPTATPGVNYPFAISRWLWDEVGGLDERFDPGPANDPDLFYRLRIAGAEFLRALDCIAYHFSGKSSRLADEASAEHRRWREVTDRNEARFEEKWGERYRYANGGLPEPGVEAVHRGLSGRDVPRDIPRLRVLFDATILREELDGVGNYVCGLLDALRRKKHEVETFALVTDPGILHTHLGSLSGLSVVSIGVPAQGVPLATEAVQQICDRIRPHVFHGPAFRLPDALPCPGVVTIHDVAFEINPSWYPSGFAQHMRSTVASACRRARGVIAVSDCTARDLAERLPGTQAPVTVIWEAPPLTRPTLHASAPASGQPSGPYFIAIGCRQPRKNTAGLLRAFQQVVKSAKGQPPKLVLTHATDAEDPAVAALLRDTGLREHVLPQAHLPEQELAALLSGAVALAYPSFYEGFGLPVLQAMAAGVPVICSDAESLKEISGGAAVHVPVEDQAGLAGAMNAVLADASLRQELILRGFARVRAFSWDLAAEKTIEVYRAASTEPAPIPSSPLPNATPPSPVVKPAKSGKAIRVAIDARMLVAPRTGTGKYTAEILPELLEVARDAEFVLIGPEQLDNLNPPAHARIVSTVRAGAETLLNPAWEQFSQVSALSACDVYFSPTGILPIASRCPAVTVAHDFAFEDRPQDFEPRLREHLSKWVRRSCEIARRIVCVSEFTKDRAARLYSVPPDRLRVVHHGRPRASLPPRQNAPRERTVLCVSAFEPNKNQKILLEAFASIARTDRVRLVLAGRRGRALDPLQRMAASLGIADSVSFDVDAPDSRLAELYREATVFAFPSLYEGFGLPVLEAMTTGIPVIASDIPACREVMGEDGIYASPESASAWLSALSTILQSKDLAGIRGDSGRRRAEEFSWERTARETWSAILEVAIE